MTLGAGGREGEHKAQLRPSLEGGVGIVAWGRGCGWSHIDLGILDICHRLKFYVNDPKMTVLAQLKLDYVAGAAF